MSVAEKTARKFYEDYHVGTLADDVQRYLIILMLSNRVSILDDHKAENYAEPTYEEQMPPRFAAEEIQSRIAQSERDILAGNTTPAQEMESRLEAKYPELCK